jgi:preprotein translocase subunit SecF
VGPAVGAFFEKIGMEAFLVALALMAVYLAFRFELKYSAGVVVAVLHDVVIAFLFAASRESRSTSPSSPPYSRSSASR